MKQLLTLLLIGSISLCAQTVPSYVPTNGLVGWWPFSGNANDLSGNGNHGTVYGATPNSDRNSNLLSSFYFDGINDYILIDSLSVNSQGTFSFWYNSDNQIITAPSSNSNSGATIISQGASNSPCNYSDFAFGLKSGYYGNGELNCPQNIWLESEFGIGCNVRYVSNCNSSFGGVGQWHSVTIVFQPGKVHRYHNGLLLDSIQTPITSLSTSGFPLSFGARYVANNSLTAYGWWKGLIDDIGIWNRALSAQEISSLFSGCQDSLLVNPQNFTAYTNPGWANFKCKSTDTAAAYQWQQNIGSGWSNLSNFGSYSGSTSDSLVITGVTSSMNNYGYRCIVTSCTTDTSDVAVLTVANGIGLGESTLQKLTVSPNPTNGFISLNAIVLGTYELLSLDGRILESGTAKKEYDLSAYPNGVYNLRLTTDEGTRVLKVVKN
jgi:hypothetical protein